MAKNEDTAKNTTPPLEKELESVEEPRPSDSPDNGKRESDDSEDSRSDCKGDEEASSNETHEESPADAGESSRSDESEPEQNVVAKNDAEASSTEDGPTLHDYLKRALTAIKGLGRIPKIVIASCLALIVVLAIAAFVSHQIDNNTYVSAVDPSELSEASAFPLSYSYPSAWEKKQPFERQDFKGSSESFYPKGSNGRPRLISFTSELESKHAEDSLASSSERVFQSVADNLDIQSEVVSQETNVYRGYAVTTGIVRDGDVARRIAAYATQTYECGIYFEASPRKIELYEDALNQIFESASIDQGEIDSLYTVSLADGEITFMKGEDWVQKKVEASSSALSYYPNGQGYPVLYVASIPFSGPFASMRYTDSLTDEQLTERFLSEFCNASFKKENVIEQGRISIGELRPLSTVYKWSDGFYASEWVETGMGEIDKRVVHTTVLTTDKNVWIIAAVATNEDDIPQYDSLVESLSVPNARKEVKTSFFADSERKSQFFDLIDQGLYSEAYGLVLEYIDTTDVSSDDPIAHIQELVQTMVGLQDRLEVITDNVTGKSRAYYAGVTDIDATTHIVPYLDNGTFYATLGFIQPDWVFFDEMRMNFDGTDEYCIASWNYFSVTRDVLGNGTVLEKVDASMSSDADLISSYKPTVIRFEGDDKSVDFTPTQRECDALSTIAALYNARSELMELAQ